MFSEAINFYSGGFWEIGTSQYEAVYAVRDIAGNAITMVSVSIPKTFSSVTQAAVGRLAFFVALVGLVFVLPIFWFQSRVLLNPLTKMTEAIANLGMAHRDTDCPRLEWKGKDEFALLAVSVNRMLETISSRALAVAQSESRQRALIDAIQNADGVYDGIVFNPAGYTHTSVALLDAVKAVSVPTVEVHLSDIDAREPFRKISYVRQACVASVIGHGSNGYLEAIDLLIAGGDR